MTGSAAIAIISALALAGGLLLGWLAARSRCQALVEAAIEKVRGAAQVDLTALTERLAAAQRDFAQERGQHQALRNRSEDWRANLDATSREMATVKERSLRVQPLESRVQELMERLGERETELRGLASSDAQKGQSVKSLTTQVEELQGTLAELQRKLDAAVQALQSSNEAKAAFEQQARRVPRLEEQLQAVQRQLAATKDELGALRETIGSENSRLGADLANEREALGAVRRELATARTTLTTAQDQCAMLTDQLTELRTRSDADQAHAAESIQLLLEAKEGLTNQFKSLATEILEEKSKRFAEQNQASLGQLLDPLKTELVEFQSKVEEVYVNEGKDRSALSQQVRQLAELNQTLSTDAKNLTQALKGQAKTQGNWGELILERVLEASGLRKGFQYRVQDSQVRADGTRAFPDVVIEMPEERMLVVDSKVSLVAYERYTTAEGDDERVLARRQHLESVRAHIRGLSEKSYHELYGVQSLDFVLAFVPVEPAFMLAVTQDNELFMEAWSRNVLLVSPSTLLFVVRTVAHLWRQESQNRNAQEIAKRGAELYDKLCGFVTDLQSVGHRLVQAKDAFDAAQNKLATGRGNAIGQAEKLRALGVKPSKALPDALLQLAGADESADTEVELLVAANDSPQRVGGVESVSP